MSWILLGVAIVLGVVALDRLALWMESRGWIYYRRSKGDTRPGDAFLQVHSLIEPDKKHLLEVRTEVREERGEAGDPPDTDDEDDRSRPVD